MAIKNTVPKKLKTSFLSLKKEKDFSCFKYQIAMAKNAEIRNNKTRKKGQLHLSVFMHLF